MNVDYKLIAALLDYPQPLTAEIIGDLENILGQCVLMDEKDKEGIRTFAQGHNALPLLDWQQEYSNTFDTSPVTSLYLFEHVYGDSRKRGAAMCALKETYNMHGLEISNGELPDYLPIFLDFLSMLTPIEETKNYLADISSLLDNIEKSLAKANSHYALLLPPLQRIAAEGQSHPLPQENT